MLPVVALFVLTTAVASSAGAQDTPATPPQAAAPAPSTGALRIFLDCNRCDLEYIRQNVGFVDYVRDRQVADVHVLVTTQFTGGGGLSWVVTFIGLGSRLGQDRTLSFDTSQTSTEDDRRKAFARILKIGLVGDAAATNAGPQLDVNWTKPAETSQTTAVKDKWNYWVFRISTNGNINGEAASTSKRVSMNVSANRTTDRWKIHFNTNGGYNSSKYIVDEATTIRSTSSNWNVNTLVVKSLTPKWSFGARGSVNHSSFSNNDLSFQLAPGLEYDFFPYSESARRSFTLQYTAGVSKYNYRELTVYDKLAETVPNHQLLSMLAFKQPWGSLELYSSFTEHLNHLERYRATFFGQAEVRLFKGFSFNIFGQYEKIKDQISLPKGRPRPRRCCCASASSPPGTATTWRSASRTASGRSSITSSTRDSDADAPDLLADSTLASRGRSTLNCSLIDGWPSQWAMNRREYLACCEPRSWSSRVSSLPLCPRRMSQSLRWVFRKPPLRRWRSTSASCSTRRRPRMRVNGCRH